MIRSLSTLLLLILICIAPLAGSAAQSTRLDSLDAFVRAQMAQRNVRGLSLAIIKDGKVAVARAYGVVDDVSKTPVTTSTLFQAGSISKPVSALGALHLVDAGTLLLDEAVNAKLKSWKVPDNSARISTALAALRDGGAALAGAADVTPGAKRDFNRGDPALASFAAATYLGDEDVAGRGIRRHGGEVSRVRLYRMPTPNGERYLMVHVTAEGAVSDYDIVLR